jgi:hypothetical protein
MEQYATLANGIRIVNLLSQKPIRFDDGTIVGGRQYSAARFKTKRSSVQETIHLPDRNIVFEGKESIRILDPSTLSQIQLLEDSDEFDIILVHINTLQALHETRDNLGLCRAPIYRHNQIIDSNCFRRR